MTTHDPVRRALVEEGVRHRSPSHSLSRILDLTVALAALVVFGPLMMIVALVCALIDRGPVFFAHRRIGLNGRSFGVLKFRSMHVDSDAILKAHLLASPEAAAEWEADHKLRDDPRVTRLGGFLRKSSLDELPQLFNVLRGEMSIVGPRPIVDAEVSRYGDLFHCYCSVKPGMTGLWQVSGRNDVGYERRVDMDALYARHKSVALDIRIILATIPAVLRRSGSY